MVPPNPNQMTFAEFAKKQAEKDPLHPSDYNNGSDQDDDYSDDRQKQSFYVGGKHSGQMVEGPEKNNNTDSSSGKGKKQGGITGLIQSIFGKARPAGDLPHDPDFEDDDEQAVFKGTAHTLSGETIKDKKQETGSGDAQPASSSSGVQRRLITFWSNGFSIDFLGDQAQHGPPVFYSYDHADADRLLQSIQQGMAPVKELKVEPNAPVEVKVSHQLGHEFNEHSTTESSPSVFTGQAQTLSGGSVINTSDNKPLSSIVSSGSVIDMTGLDTEHPVVAHQVRTPRMRFTIRVNPDTMTNALLYSFLAGHLGTDVNSLIYGHPPTELVKDNTFLKDSLSKPTLLTVK